MNNIFKLSAFASLCCTVSLPVSATENGTIAYPLGVNSVYPGLFPAPGETWLQDYTAYYSSNTVSNAQGNKIAIPRFRASVAVGAIRLFHTWDQAIGPFTLSSAFVLTGGTGEVGTPVTSNGLVKGTAAGDLTIQPLYLGYTNEAKNFFAYTGVDYFIPTGTWLSSNYYSIVPNYSFTWFLSPLFDVSATVGLDLHLQNDKTKYHSGTVFSLITVSIIAFSPLFRNWL